LADLMVEKEKAFPGLDPKAMLSATSSADVSLPRDVNSEGYNRALEQ